MTFFTNSSGFFVELSGIYGSNNKYLQYFGNQGSFENIKETM